MGPRQSDKPLAVLDADAGRIDHGEAPGRQSFARNQLEHLERVAGRLL
ncbi:hypothetical protein ACVWY6_004232 [Williamsia sp. R60]